MIYKEEIKQLRGQYPVAIQTAKRYLEATNGSVEKAIFLFTKEMRNQFVNKMQAREEEALKFLEEANYDIEKAMDAYEKEGYSSIENIILNTPDKEEALDNMTRHVYDILTEEANIDDPESYKAYRKFYVIKSWMDYYDWEGDLVFFGERGAEVVSVLNSFGFTDLTSRLTAVNTRLREHIDKGANISQIYSNDETIRHLYKTLLDSFDEQREEVIDNLYKYVTENLPLFRY